MLLSWFCVVSFRRVGGGDGEKEGMCGGGGVGEFGGSWGGGEGGDENLQTVFSGLCKIHSQLQASLSGISERCFK